MKRLIGWTLSWAFYWLGDLTSRVNDLINPEQDWLCDLCYWWYNRPMMLSVRLQDWGGAGPWINTPTEQQEPNNETSPTR